MKRSQHTVFCRLLTIDPKSCGFAFGFVSLGIYSGLSCLGVLWLLLGGKMAFSSSFLLSLLSGAVVFPAFCFALGLLIATIYNGYARWQGGITVEVSTLWNP